MKNLTKQKIELGEATFGLFHVTANSLISEALTATSIDWLVYDMEASPTDRMGIVHFLQSLKGSSVTPIVRVLKADNVLVEQALDAGCEMIVVPKVETAEVCEAMVNASKFPPLGNRGVNPIRASNYLTNVMNYFETSDNNTSVFIQIETKLAVENIDSLLSVNGLDGVFIGCGDLAMDLGCPGQMDSPVLLEKIDFILKKCIEYKKIPGVFAYNIDLAKNFAKDGFKLIAFGNDIVMLHKAINNDIETLTKLNEKGD